MSRRDGEPGGGEAELLRDPRLLPPREERGCPPGESWAALVDGTIAPAKRETLLDHLAGCPDCAIEVRTLRELKTWSRELAGEAPALAPPRVSRRFDWPWAAALAAILLLPLLTLLLRQEPPLPASGVRGDAIAAAAVEPPDGALLPTAPARLRWSPVADARQYRVQLLDAEASLLWTSSAGSETTIDLPRELRERLAAGRTYLWRVEILLDGDSRRSPTYAFRLGP